MPMSSDRQSAAVSHQIKHVKTKTAENIMNNPTHNTDSVELNEMMLQIRNYWVTASGEPELREFAEYVLTLIKVSQSNILRTAIDNIHDEIDAGVPEDLASRTVLLQMEYDLLQTNQPNEQERSE
jgi:hypothetical protein